MIKTTQYIPQNWTFEVHTKESIDRTSPTVILLGEEFQEGHNSKFPYKIEVIYYVDNPNNFVTRQPTFALHDNEKLLLLRHSCSNPEVELTSIIQIMKKAFNSDAYNDAKPI